MWTRAAIALLALIWTPAVADTQKPPDPIILGGAFVAQAFEEFPKAVDVTVLSYDDSPDMKRILQQFEVELTARGLRNGKGKAYAILVALETRVLNPSTSGGVGKPVVYGALRTDLVRVPEGVVIWESEVVYEPRDGDILGGAIRVTPLVVETLGQERSMPRLGRF